MQLLSFACLLFVCLAQTVQFNVTLYINTVGNGYGCYGIDGKAPTRLVSIVTLSPSTAVQYYSDYGCKTIINTHTMQPQHWVGPVPDAVSSVDVYSVNLIPW
ncbi:hypothetical protein HK103_004934 [Boothiomyces macroporosus]|uniref:Secreted protein n=1 Tax=Boothiomyces macroporosus TaxID=261099 RepID=A0AAD5UIV8_9FUNG|nr:hypothetical protein HK103_004934 [Boothiomyces macroporosus]